MRAESLATDAFYYGHYYSSGSSNAGVSNNFSDGAGNYNLLPNSAATGQPFATGPASMSVLFDVTGQQMRTRFTNSTGSYDVMSPTPLLTTMPHYHLDARGGEIKIFYFAIVSE